MNMHYKIGFFFVSLAVESPLHKFSFSIPVQALLSSQSRAERDGGFCILILIYFFILPLLQVVAPEISGNQTNPKKVEELRQNVSKMIFQLERYFLKDKKYIAGDEISIADIFAACELTELLACHEQGLYENSPITQAWMERVRTETNPYFDEAHKMIYQFQSKYKKPASKL